MRRIRATEVTRFGCVVLGGQPRLVASAERIAPGRGSGDSSDRGALRGVHGLQAEFSASQMIKGMSSCHCAGFCSKGTRPSWKTSRWDEDLTREGADCPVAGG